MNYLRKALAGITILTITGLSLTSCGSDDLKIDENALEQDITIAKTQTEIDDVSEEINDIGESIYLMYGNIAASKDSDTKTEIEGIHLPECLTITKVISFEGVDITLDYGDGCTNHNENYLSGKIMMSIGFNLAERSISIDYTFDDFYFNGKKVEGEMQRVKLKINESGNPVSTTTQDIKITWENGEYVTVKGERQREWIEGFGDKIWGDNVFSITGNWMITDQDNISKTVKIVEPLIRKTACRFIVSGIVEIDRDGNITTINYGNGECDNIAMGNRDGEEFEIQLGKRE